MAYPTWQTATMRKRCALEKGLELFKFKYYIFFLPVNIYSWCDVPTLLAVQPTIICLDYSITR